MSLPRAMTSVQRLASILANEMPAPTDEQLLHDFVERASQEAFAELLNRHGRMVRGVCRRVLGNSPSVDDAWQATFLLLARKSRSLSVSGSLAGWLYGAAYRIALNERRAMRRRAIHEGRGTTAEIPPVDRQAIWNEMQQIVDAETNRLPAVYREVFIRCCLESESRTRVARELGLNAATVRGRLAKARRILRDRLAGRGITLSTALTMVALSTDRVSADLKSETLHAAIALSEKAVPLAGLVSPRVEALVQSAVPGWHVGTFAATLALVLAGVVGTCLTQLPASPADPVPPKKPAEVVQKVDEPRTEEGDPLPAGALARLGSIRFRPGASVHALAFDPTGKQLASWGNAMHRHDLFHIWDAETGKQLVLEKTAEGSLSTLAWTPRGGLAVIRTSSRFQQHPLLSDFRLIRYGKDLEASLPGGVPAAPPRPPAAAGVSVTSVSCIALSADGERLAVATQTGNQADKILILEVVPGKPLSELKVLTSFPPPEKICFTLAFSPDGRHLVGTAATSTDGKSITGSMLLLWNKEGRLVHTVEAPVIAAQGYRLTVAVSNRHVALGLVDGDSAVVDLATGKLRTIATAHKSTGSGQGFGTFGVAIAPDGKTLASTGRDGMVRLSDIETGKLVREFGKHLSWPEALAYSPDGKRIASAGQDNVIRVWDVATGKPAVEDNGGSPGSLWNLVISENGRTAVTNTGTGQLRVWDVERGSDRLRIDVPEGIQSFQISPDGRHVIIAVGEPRKFQPALKVREVATGKDVTPAGFPDSIRALGMRFQRDGKSLLVFGEDKLGCWSWPEGKPLWTTTMPKPAKPEGINDVGAISLSPDGRHFITVASRSWYKERDGLRFGYAADGVVDLFETATGKHVRRLVEAQHCFRPGVYLADGTYLHNGSGLLPGDRGQAEIAALAVIDPLTGRFVRNFTSTSTGLESGFTLALSADGRVLFQPTDSGGVHLYEVATGQFRRAFSGHLDIVFSLAPPLDVRRLLSGSKDTTALYWDVGFSFKQGEPLDAEERSLAWEELQQPDGQRGYAAMVKLAGDPAGLVKIAAEQLKPAPAGPSAEELARVFRDMDSKSFPTREAASRALDQFGDAAIRAVRNRLETETAPEVRERLIRFLESREGPGSLTGRLRNLRAIELLEQLGTPEAVALLTNLSRGGPSPLTEEARAALERISRR